ncbi:glycosyltransferase [Jannaschia sp. R86511]|uniref:glycosyltransferase n=1 Tax=Jannaschia sp. R86511 TaxID=3093853 RepID=UPI0036D31449
MSPSETAPSTASGPPGRVGYVLKMYPRFSETFVVNEILAQEAAGTEVDVFSLRPPADARFHAALAEVRAGVTWVPWSSVRASEAWDRLGAAADQLPGLASAWPELLRHDVRDVLQAVEVATAVRERGLVHLHAHFGSVATTVARLAARLARVGYSFTAHAKDIFHDSVDEADLRVKLRDALAVVTVSDYNLEHLRTRFGPAADRVVRVYNGIDLTAFGYREPAGRPRHVVSVGRLVEKKGLDDLIGAVALLAADGDPVTCDVIGSGPLHDDLARQVEQLGLTDRVRLLGAATQDEVREHVAGAAVFAAPCVVGTDGNRDGLPTVVLEAMALGTAVVATPVTGMPEAVVDGRTGRLVPERAPAELAAAIRGLLDDEAARADLARAARALVEQRFDRDVQAQGMRAVFARAGSEPVRPTGDAAAESVGAVANPAVANPAVGAAGAEGARRREVVPA